jgi:hypothetical protein
MAKLEEAAKPILLPLILGQARVLNETESEILTRWALKTAMVLEFTHPKGLAIPPTDRRRLRQGHLPEHAQVWIALYDGTNNTFYYHDHHRSRHADGSVTSLAYAVTFGAGHAMFQIWVSSAADRQIENVGPLSAVLQQIRPYRSPVSVGPDALNDDGMAWVVASQRNPISRNEAEEHGLIS